MTDQLETDLRTMLAERAGAVRADLDAGEAVIARRLASGDQGLAEVVAFASPRRRPWLIAAAAALVVAVGAVVVLAQDDDPDVRTGPYATDLPPPPAAVLEFRPVIGGGDAPTCQVEGAGLVLVGRDSGEGETCFVVGDPLPGNDLLQSVGRYVSFSSTGAPIGGDPATTPSTAAPVEEFGITLQLTADGMVQLNTLVGECVARSAICPTGRLAVVVDEIVLAAPEITQLLPADEPLQVGTFTEAEADALVAALRPDTTASSGNEGTTTTTDASIDEGDPTIGEAGDSAKDVAERTMREVFDEDAVTMEVGTRANGDDLVTMETSAGAPVQAFVTFDESLGRFRLVGLQSDKFQPFRDAGYLSIPAEGRLTIAALDAPGEPTPSTLLIADLPIDHAGTDHGPFALPDDGWLWMTLVTNDGKFLYHLSQR